MTVRAKLSPKRLRKVNGIVVAKITFRRHSNFEGKLKEMFKSATREWIVCIFRLQKTRDKNHKVVRSCWVCQEKTKNGKFNTPLFTLHLKSAHNQQYNRDFRSGEWDKIENRRSVLSLTQASPLYPKTIVFRTVIGWNKNKLLENKTSPDLWPKYIPDG